ncbi:unnamed protein product [Lota lota]
MLTTNPTGFRSQRTGAQQRTGEADPMLQKGDGDRDLSPWESVALPRAVSGPPRSYHCSPAVPQPSPPRQPCHRHVQGHLC